MSEYCKGCKERQDRIDELEARFSDSSTAAGSILHLTLHKRWFDMIASGEKKEEYREMKPFWHKRLSKKYDYVKFVNGYGADRPWMLVELKEVLTSLGIIEWGAPAAERVYILKLGRIIKSNDQNQVERC